MKYIYVILLSTISINIYAQSNCYSYESVAGVPAVDVSDVICIAQKSDKDISLFYTFTAWCSPCREKLPILVELSKKNSIYINFLIVDREIFLPEARRSIDFVRQNMDDSNIYLTSDSLC